MRHKKDKKQKARHPEICFIFKIRWLEMSAHPLPNFLKMME
jgi:hypothetical protein